MSVAGYFVGHSTGLFEALPERVAKIYWNASDNAHVTIKKA
jgi:hypothetical protein